ncbi:Crp/Fnr family transcriptional regulator [Rhodopseudomonas palustris]|uniref:Crp/Fnr family transcriptional regulator n=1 Tax=Rhodopseudomonas palustris TaxID=1076 RepID=A0A323UC41_RHOPL|nr:Crp/Fnr family transcriptional regulator [Rhodopseudomonas palustris]PZA09793.1 Crp/Fnr family transcriptional regulator [Rhodopseudomonas palustris]
MLHSPERPNNNLLRALSAQDYELIRPHLRYETKAAEELLYRPGDHVGSAYFPCGPSLVSYEVTDGDGRNVETVLVGREGAVGGIVSSGFLPAYCLIVVKFEGPFVRVPIVNVQSAKDRSLSFKNMFARYADCLMAQMFQATACNAIHSIEQRSAKWIAAAMDRTGENLVPLTHDQLAAMLGVGRSYTSRVLQVFRQEGILTTRRGALIVNDPDKLRLRACRCNEAVKEHFDIVLRGVYPEPDDAAVA